MHCSTKFIVDDAIRFVVQVSLSEPETHSTQVNALSPAGALSSAGLTTSQTALPAPRGGVLCPMPTTHGTPKARLAAQPLNRSGSDPPAESRAAESVTPADAPRHAPLRCEVCQLRDPSTRTVEVGWVVLHGEPERDFMAVCARCEVPL